MYWMNIGFLLNPNMKIQKFFKSVRYSLAAANVLFVLTGLLMLIVGAVVLVKYLGYEPMITQRFIRVSSLVIATSVLILFTSILGFYGAVSRQFYFIAGYTVMVLLILILEMSVVIVSFDLKKDTAVEIRSTMMETLRLYSDRREMAVMWDDMQMKFECCGVTGRSDWIANEIPISCCFINPGTISPFECRLPNAHTIGCAQTLGEWLSYNANTLAVTTLFVFCLHVLIAAVAGWSAYRSKYEEIELES